MEKTERLREYNIALDKHKFEVKTNSYGSQPKLRKGGYYYKMDREGREGLVEYLVYRLLRHTNLPENCYVKYERCKINGEYGCRSKDFLGDEERYISMNGMYRMLTGNSDLADRLMVMRTPEERYLYLEEMASSVGIERETFRNYMKAVVELDMLIENIDRHTHNYGFVYNYRKDSYRPAPIFDNGMGLRTSNRESVACTLCSSFEIQVATFGYPIRSSIKIDYEGLMHDIARIKRMYGSSPELKRLYENARKYEGIFRRQD